MKKPPYKSPPPKKRLYGYRKTEAETPRLGDVRPAGSAILEHFKRLGLGERFHEQRAVREWSNIVGAKIAGAAQAVSIKDGVLRISVKDSSWRQELMYLKEQIIEKLNRELGELIVRDLFIS